ncbi:MAG: hypothetical protein QOJ42_2669, partial [Acidobacteriaceae bacterium]|nr:hypothetical protein [Acidobacteriaceae bacterium]
LECCSEETIALSGSSRIRGKLAIYGQDGTLQRAYLRAVFWFLVLYQGTTLVGP